MSTAGLNRLEEARRALRYARRGLIKSPWFLGVAVLTLGLGIGVNTAIFSVIYSTLIAPLPYDDAGRLVLIRQSSPLAGPAPACHRLATPAPRVCFPMDGHAPAASHVHSTPRLAGRARRSQ